MHAHTPMASGVGALHFLPATWRAEIPTEEDEPTTGCLDVPWDPPAPPLVAQGEVAEEYPGGGNKSLHAPLGPAEGHFHFNSSLEKRVTG